MSLAVAICCQLKPQASPITYKLSPGMTMCDPTQPPRAGWDAGVAAAGGAVGVTAASPGRPPRLGRFNSCPTEIRFEFRLGLAATSACSFTLQFDAIRIK